MTNQKTKEKNEEAYNYSTHILFAVCKERKYDSDENLRKGIFYYMLT